MSRKYLVFITVGVVVCLMVILWFYQSTSVFSANHPKQPVSKPITLKLVEYNFSADYNLPEYRHKPAVNMKEYLLETSNSHYEIPEDYKLSCSRELNSAQYQLLRYYLANMPINWTV